MALLRVTNGASTAAWLRPMVSAVIDAVVAASFSAVMRWYSAALHVPCAINRLRSHIVSQEAIASSASIMGTSNGDARGCFLIQ